MRKFLIAVLISAGIFGLALLPRAYDLGRFVTADEAKWVYRSAQFWAAFQRGDWAGTNVNLTPAVTTTWLGSLGLLAYHNTVQPGPLTEWLLSLPEFRTTVDILAMTRWPMVMFTALGVVGFYWLARYLFMAPLAMLAAVFVALDPHFVALSRVLGHDATTTVFMTLSLLGLLAWLKSDTPGWLVGSAVLAGLAFLSKAPALFLIPFAGLVVLYRGWHAQRWQPFAWGVGWLVVAYLVFVVGWPAAWVAPIEQPFAVVENAFLSATDQEEADSEGYWQVPNLGPTYYLVHGAFKLSPLVMVGLVLAGWLAWRRKLYRLDKHLLESPWTWLVLYAVLFTIFMTLGEKRSPRYILPVFPVLGLLAAWGWGILADTVIRGRMYQLAFIPVMTLAAALSLIPYAPYYFSYFNPLVGGPYLAPHAVKLGWGEGLDQVGRMLEREFPGRRIGTPYASTVAAFFSGDISAVDSDRLDYVVLYAKQVQSGEPFPAYIRYFWQQSPVYAVDLNGIRYAEVYRGPAVQPVESIADGSTLQPIGFRPLTPHATISQTLTVDVLWSIAESLPTRPITLSLTADNSTLAAAPGVLAQRDTNLVVSRHALSIPAEAASGEYTLRLDDRPLGTIAVRGFEVPSNFGGVRDVIFEGEIGLVGYQFGPTPDFIQVTLAWRAERDYLPDYTVFVHLLDANTGNRLAGIDRQGEWSSSRWIQDEVVVHEYLVAVPPDLTAGHYLIMVGLYRPDTGERLVRANGEDHWLIPWTFIKK